MHRGKHVVIECDALVTNIVKLKKYHIWWRFENVELSRLHTWYNLHFELNSLQASKSKLVLPVSMCITTFNIVVLGKFHPELEVDYVSSNTF